jgi:hypothetical protein
MDRYFLSTRGFLLVTGVVVALLMAGCGGSGSGSEVSVETGPLTKAQFVEQADRLCEKSKAQLQRKFGALLKSSVALAKSTGAKPSAESLQTLHSDAVTTILIPTYGQMIDQISSLGAPSDDQEQVTAFLDAMQQALDEAEEHPSKPFNNVKFFDPFTKLAGSYGLTACSLIG